MLSGKQPVGVALTEKEKARAALRRQDHAGADRCGRERRRAAHRRSGWRASSSSATRDILVTF
ncbi:MAG: hypothetical protein MZW92_59720 [Comamonadaceae bacterium]|nr:hypothetical protein [Comamonadaceae bacterium]